MKVDENAPEESYAPFANPLSGGQQVEQVVRVLLVEDNPGDARLIREFIAESGGHSFEVEWVQSLQAGRERLSQGGISVALLDLSLPDSHGLPTFVQIHEHAPGVPIVVLSGLADETLAVEAVHAGAQDYLVKGQGDGRLLVRAMRYAVERSMIAEQINRYAEELRKKNTQMQADLSMAREIQQIFLPQQYPCFPPSVNPDQSSLQFHHRYQPAATIGGDFFTVFPVNDSTAGVFICDVMGHGLRAALITAVLRGLVEELKPEAGDVGRFLAEINRGFHSILRRTDQMMMATAFYVLIDSRSGQIQFANAGHPSPLLVRRREGKVDPLSTVDPRHGPALGIFDKASYPSCRCTAQEEDVVILFTDGLYEITGPGDQEFGRDRLLTTIRQHLKLPTPEIFDETYSAVQQFAGSASFEDDVCLVGAELTRKLK